MLKSVLRFGSLIRFQVTLLSENKVIFGTGAFSTGKNTTAPVTYFIAFKVEVYLLVVLFKDRVTLYSVANHIGPSSQKLRSIKLYKYFLTI